MNARGYVISVCGPEGSGAFMHIERGLQRCRPTAKGNARSLRLSDGNGYGTTLLH